VKIKSIENSKIKKIYKKLLLCYLIYQKNINRIFENNKNKTEYIIRFKFLIPRYFYGFNFVYQNK